MGTVHKLPKRKRQKEESIPDLIQRLEQEVRRLEDKIESLGGKIEDGAKRVDILEAFLSLLKMIDVREYLQAEDVDEFGLDVEFEEKIQEFFDLLYNRYWRVEVEGVENIPAKGPVLMVSNHSGTLPYDGSMIKMAVKKEHPAGREVRFMVEDFVYHFPFLGTFMYRIGGVRACPENAIRLLENNHPVLTFPEGIKGIGKLYAQRYRLQRFGRGGFIRIAMKTKTPIVPISVVGAEEIHPIVHKVDWFARLVGLPYIPITPTFPLLGPLGLIPFPTKWKIQFGEPIPFDQYTPAQMENPILVNQLAEQVRQQIQSMIAETLKTRLSIWS